MTDLVSWSDRHKGQPSDNKFTLSGNRYPHSLSNNQALFHLLTARGITPRQLMRQCADFCQLHHSLDLDASDEHWERLWNIEMPAYAIYVVAEVLGVDAAVLLGQQQLREVIDTRKRLAASDVGELEP